jgi:hypothetical protein
MDRQFFEVTVTTDSSNGVARQRNAMIRRDQVASSVDIDGESLADRARVMITLAQPEDYVNTDDDVGGVVRASRTLFVQEDYTQVKQLVMAES